MPTLSPIAWSDTPLQSILERVYALVTQSAPAELADVEAALRGAVADLQSFLSGLGGVLSFAVVQLGDGEAASPKAAVGLDPTQPTYTANVRFTAEPAKGVERVVRLVMSGGWSAGTLLDAVRRLADLRAQPSGALGSPPSSAVAGKLVDPSAGVALAAYVCEAAVRGSDEDFLNALCALIQAAPPSLGHTGIVADDVNTDLPSASQNAVGVPKWLALNDGAGGLQLDLALSLQLPESDDPMVLRFQSSVAKDVLASLRGAVRRLWLPGEPVADLEVDHWSVYAARLVRALSNPSDGDSWASFSGQPLPLVRKLDGTLSTTGCAGDSPVKLSATGAADDDALSMTLCLSAPVDGFGASTVQLGLSVTSADFHKLRSDLLATTRAPATAA